MITHVKKNSQRIAFTKLSHIERAVQFRKQIFFHSHSFNCRNPRENSSYYGQRDRGAELNEYMREMEKRCNILSSYGVF